MKSQRLRKPLLFLLFLSFSPFVFGQILTTYPAFPSADQEITLVFDLSKASDGRAAALLNRSDDVYLWAWGGANPANRSTPEYTLDAQTSFNQAFAPAKLTPLGANRWSIRFTPRAFLKLGTDKTLRWMGALVKSGNGSAQTEDVTFELYLPTVQVAFFSPNRNNLAPEAGSSLSVLAMASTRATLSLTLDGQPIASVSDTVLRATVPVGPASSTPRTLRITASANGQTARDSLTFSVLPAPTVEALPAGLKDGITYAADGRSATLVLLAPGKKSVYLLGEFNNWELRAEFLMKKTPDGQRFWLPISGLAPGGEVAFQYLVDGQIPTGDPYAEKLLDRQNDASIPASTYPNPKPFPTAARGNVVSVLQPGKSAFAWQTTAFQRPTSDNLVIYELLVRDFTAAGNYTALIDTIPYLKRLGVNCVELMPVNEFSANDSWGYNPTYFLAPDKAYGTEQALKTFIDRCHGAGIAVVLDVVFNHADYEFPYVKMYWDGSKPSADSPMFNQAATHPFNVFFDVNHDSDLARNYFGRVLEHWLTAYRVDGFRFDLSKGFTQKKTSNDSQFRLYDATRIANLNRFNDRIRALDPTAYVILEHFAEDREELELTNAGMLVWGNQNGDFRAALKGTGGTFDRLSYKTRGFAKPAVIGYAESHDEERLLFDAQRNASTADLKTLKTGLERAKAAASLLLLTPGPKMIWQFGELGYDVSIDENGRTGRKPIRWEYYRDADRLKLYKVYSELIRLKKTLAAARGTDFSLSQTGAVQQLSVSDGTNWIRVLANFSTTAQEISTAFPTGSGTPQTWYDFFGGPEIRLVDPANPPKLTFRPGEFHVYTSEKVTVFEPNLTPWNAAVSAITALEPTLSDPWLTVYPNPTSETLILQLENDYRGEVALEISDLGGRRLTHFYPRKDQPKLVQHLPIRELTPGVYLLNVREGERQTVRKFVKE